MVGILGLSGGRSAGSGSNLRRRDESGNQVRPCVGSNVEDRVDAIREHGEGILRHEEPDNGHHFGS